MFSFQHATNQNTTNHFRGDPFYTVPEENPCDKFIQHKDVGFVGDVSYNLVKGFVHQLSQTICPPGSIGHTYSVSTSWSVNGQIGPDMVRHFIVFSICL